ncbi:MAG: C10 family peptidase [Bacteroidaceae bacterium]|nr:C10 family peptidase [Bacteroidaceae bacterium]
MKRILSLLLCVMAIAAVEAAPITREQARKRAIEFLQGTRGSHQLAPVVSRTKLAPRRKAAAAGTATQQDEELYYVFNRGTNEGFVIVSGDDQTLPVLGYTEEGEFDYNALPANMRYWLDSREQQLLELSQNGNVGQPRRAIATHDKIAPMVTTKWNQGSPYNDECPMYFTLGRSVTGCVATAMAQVLYYQRAKSVTEVQADIPGYTGWTAHATYGNLVVEGIEAGSPIDWDNMLDSYGSGASAKQKKAVAQLMHYCGVSVHMDYTNGSSGAQSSEVPTAFQKYFGYGSKTRIVYQTSYSDEAWDKLLYSELAEGRPFYLSGYNEEGGHAFVCDGYDGNYCFHINWGWGGASDGYYMLAKLNPGSQGIGGSSGGYSEGEAAVIGCEPDNYSEKAMPIANTTVKKLCLANWDTNGDGVFTFGEAAAVTDLGNVFKGQTAITAFTELYNFTGLTSLSDDAFNGCTKLASVRLPKSLKHIGKRSFAGCRVLKTFALTDGLLSIGDSAFAGCRMLPNLLLPSGITRIEDNTFESCLAFTAMELPLGIQYIGRQAFSGCTKLTSVTVKSVSPQHIVLGASVFEDIDLSKATLNTLQGTRSYFSTADQWKEFGNLYEERNLSQGKFATLETNKKFYLYNVGTGYYMTKGEAWGTQAIVADTDNPMRFELRHTASMPDGVYYLYSDDTGNASRHVLFRTSSDTGVGNGVKACFVDGTLSANTGYWSIQAVEGQENVYTIQIPSNNASYKAGQFLGVQPDHDSNAASPTYGTYSDIAYDDYMQNCQWMFVAYDQEEATLYQSALVLKNLLTIGKSKRVNTTQEQAVYDNFNSTEEEIAKACRKLRNKLNFINFTDDVVREVALSHYDIDSNGEISFSEAASVENIDMEFSGNTALKDLTDLRLFTGLNYLSGNSFKDCTALTTVKLPTDVTDIYYRAFMGCKKLERVEMGQYVKNLGDNAFTNCTSLKEFRIAVSDPAKISLGNNVFSTVTIAKAVLYVPQGCKELYAQAPTWKNFGEIREMRAVKAPQYAVPEANTDYYVYNLGMQRSIKKGEAYGTQAVVDLNGFVYQLRRSNSMPENVYYLYAEGSGTTNHVLFRTDTDTKVGEGIKTCFVDGTLSTKAYWKIEPVEGMTNVYTLSVPSTDAAYVAGEYLGTDYDHATDYAYGTYGLYWDVQYTANPAGCQWAFIKVDDVKAAQAFFDLTETLRELLVVADGQGVDDAAEHAVYDDFDSTEEAIHGAIASLRAKLHYIDFMDSHAKTIAVNAWDDNEDGELSREEAAQVTDLGQTFRAATGVRSLEELQYFTSLTALPDEAFRNCTSLISIYLPKGVTAVGEDAFSSTGNLKYMAVLSETGVVEAANAALPKSLTVFVPKSLTGAYAADETWNKGTIEEFTGTPTVTAEPATRIYGRSNPSFTFAVTGAPINGVPTLTTEAEVTSVVGDYAITVEAGTVTSPGFQPVNGVLTIARAPLTLTAKSYKRNVGEENPEFDFTHSSLKNREKIADVLLVAPTLECDATATSPAGTYEIRISGAETQNYEITYANGTLTVIDPTGITNAKAETENGDVYDLAGRKVASQSAKGLYIRNGKKLIIK